MSLNVGILGPSTLAGEALFEVLDGSDLEIDKLWLFALPDSEELGKTLMFRSHSSRIREWGEESAAVDLLFVADPAITAEQIDAFRKGAQIVDLYGQRFGERADFIVTGVNNDAVSRDSDRILACPEAAVTTAAMALNVLHQRHQLLRINITALQPAADLGKAGVEALAAEAVKLLNGRSAEHDLLPAQFAFNVHPQVGSTDSLGQTQVEQNIADQFKKVFADEQIEIVVNAIQAPIFYGLTDILQVETQTPVEIEELRREMSRIDNLEIADGQRFHTPVGDAMNSDRVHVSRIRHEIGNDSGVGMCAISDSLRRGLALNALGIASAWLQLQR